MINVGNAGVIFVGATLDAKIPSCSGVYLNENVNMLHILRKTLQ